MSINKIECAGGRLTLHGDYVVYHQDGVQFELHGDSIPGFLKGSKKGNIFVSTNRVIFAPTVQTDVGSFSMNFRSIRGVEVKQPMFGANYIKGDVISEPEGGWQGRGTFNITFNSGGAIEFAEHFRQAVASAGRPGSQPMPAAGGYQTFGIYNNPTPQPQPGYYNGPPYQTPYPPQPGYYGAPPPQPGYYGAPPTAGGFYAAQPPPYRPPENPPPYPGQSAPMAPPSAPPPDFPGAGGVKAQEAYTSGQNVYVPANQPPPPPYFQEHKKNV
ncbi:WW domain-binding protein 2 [Exaiptasia diaphana]|uniref:GRAM domain-containing protein n=1 Tax=Exaiptasia diaphana TaxID=2652724 RepID=A0A913XYV1_EXADI|nr:WW domain-binding protein 2 [Exaiptasia diaphana]